MNAVRQMLAVVAALALVGYSPRARAASAFAGALEPTQLSNFIQLVQQCMKMKRMVESGQQQVSYWKQNVGQFKDPRHFLLAKALVTDVAGMIVQYRSLAYGRDASGELFKQQHPGYREPPDGRYDKAYREIDKQTFGAVERALKAYDVQLTDAKGGIKAESELIKELAAKAQGADGVVKALGVTNELLVVIATQLQKLEVTMTAHGQVMANYVANEVQRRSYEEYGRDQFFQFSDRYRPQRAPVDWSREGTRGLL